MDTSLREKKMITGKEFMTKAFSFLWENPKTLLIILIVMFVLFIGFALWIYKKQSDWVTSGLKGFVKVLILAFLVTGIIMLYQGTKILG